MLRYAERPGSALRVARVFPDGFDAALEEVHAVAEGQQGGVEIVEEVPEGADVVYRGEAHEAFFVGGAVDGCGVVGGGGLRVVGVDLAAILTVVPEVPAVD